MRKRLTVSARRFCIFYRLKFRHKKLNLNKLKFAFKFGGLQNLEQKKISEFLNLADYKFCMI